MNQRRAVKLCDVLARDLARGAGEQTPPDSFDRQGLLSHLPTAVTGLAEADVFLLSTVHSQANLGWLLLRVQLEFHPGQAVKEFGKMTLHLQNGLYK